MVCLYGSYDSRLSQLEHAFPLPFPWNDDTRQDVPRFFRDADGWWRDPKAYPTGQALAIARELDIADPILPEYTGLERSIRPFKDIHLVLHTACPDAASAKAALQTAKTLGPVVAICDTRFADQMEGAEVVLTTQPYEDREARHAAEHALENKALAVIKPGHVVLLCGMRDCTLNTTLRRLFGFTDGVITDLW